MEKQNPPSDSTEPAFSNQQPGTPPSYYPAQQDGDVGIAVTEETVLIPRRSQISFVGAFALSVCVLVCCGSICGLMALIVAVIGYAREDSGDESNAMILLRVSYALSIIGIIVSVVVVIVVVVLTVKTCSPLQDCSYYHHDTRGCPVCCNTTCAQCSYGCYSVNGMDRCCSVL